MGVKKKLALVATLAVAGAAIVEKNELLQGLPGMLEAVNRAPHNTVTGLENDLTAIKQFFYRPPAAVLAARYKDRAAPYKVLASDKDAQERRAETIADAETKSAMAAIPAGQGTPDQLQKEAGKLRGKVLDYEHALIDNAAALTVPYPQTALVRKIFDQEKGVARYELSIGVPLEKTGAVAAEARPIIKQPVPATSAKPGS